MIEVLDGLPEGVVGVEAVELADATAWAAG